MGKSVASHPCSCPRTGLGHFQTVLPPGACQTIPPQHLWPPSDVGTPCVCARTHSPSPSPITASSGQLLKPQEAGNSLQPYKQQQAHRQQHSQLLREKHNSSKDAWASKFTRVLKSGARIRASYKGDAKQPPRSILITSRSTGAAFHAAASRGNLIHFLIRHRLFPVQRSQMEVLGGICSSLYPKTQPWEGFTRRHEHWWQGCL